MTSFAPLVKADFFERIRRYSFLITLIFTLYAGYAFVPGPDDSYVTLALGKYRGLYNSAWIGSMMAIMASTFLGLVGFYLVKGSLERDRRTGVGQILASTPLSTFRYLGSKALSNLAVLAAMVLALTIMAGVMQLARGEDRSLDAVALLSPFLLSTLPVLALVAAFAIAFESVPLLRSVLGNVVYYALWTASLILSLQGRAGASPFSVFYDLTATGPLVRHMQSAASQSFPDYAGELSIGIHILEVPREMQTFVWNGIDWSVELILARLMLVLCAVGVVAIAALLFDRFDDQASVVKRKGPSGAKEVSPQNSIEERSPSSQLGTVHLSRLADSGHAFRFVAMIRSELTLMVKGTSRWWLLVALGLVIAQVLSPFEIARQWLLPISSLWPLAIWSQMGTRERTHGTEQMVFSTNHLLTRQLPALWLSGVAVAIACGAGFGLKSLILGEWAPIVSWLLGSLFVPSLALAFGTLSGSRRLFEAVYMILWYMGPMNHNPYLDYIGATRDSYSLGIPLYIGVLTAGSLLIAVAARRRQIAT